MSATSWPFSATRLSLGQFGFFRTASSVTEYVVHGGWAMPLRKVPVADVKVGKRTRKDMGDLSRLKDSIEAVGLLHPIVLTSDFNLVAGERRLAAWKLLDNMPSTIPAHVVNSLDEAAKLIRAEADENTCRKDFMPEEAYDAGEKLLKVEKPAADERAAEGRKKGGKISKRGRKLPGNFPGSNTEERARDKVGECVGMSGKSWKNLKTVMESKDKEAKDELKKSGKINSALRKLKQNQKRAELDAWKAEQAKNPTPITGPVDLILADPPWSYEHSKDNRDVNNHYPTATLEEIKAHIDADWMPELAKNCVLFMWTTAPKLAESCQVMDAWGFSYRTCAVWDKVRMGMGYWFRSQHELILLGVRGKPKSPLEGDRPSSLFVELRNNKHSKKPDCVYEAIEEMLPRACRLEVYSRSKRKGWQSVGNDV